MVFWGINREIPCHPLTTILDTIAPGQPTEWWGKCLTDQSDDCQRIKRSSYIPQKSPIFSQYVSIDSKFFFVNLDMTLLEIFEDDDFDGRHCSWSADIFTFCPAVAPQQTVEMFIAHFNKISQFLFVRKKISQPNITFRFVFVTLGKQ